MKSRRRWTFPHALEDGPDLVPTSGGYTQLPAPLTNRQLAKLIEDVESGGNLATAAKTVNRSERWLTYQLQAYPAIKAKIGNARAIADGQVQRAIFLNSQLPGREGVADRVWWTKNRIGWADRQHVSKTVDINLIPRLVSRARDPERIARVRAQIEDERVEYVRAMAAREALPAAAGEEREVVEAELVEAVR